MMPNHRREHVDGSSPRQRARAPAPSEMSARRGAPPGAEFGLVAELERSGMNPAVPKRRRQVALEREGEHNHESHAQGEPPGRLPPVLAPGGVSLRGMRNHANWRFASSARIPLRAISSS